MNSNDFSQAPSAPSDSLRSFLVLWLCLFAVIIARTAWKAIPSDNEIQYLSIVRRAVEPDWLARDFALGPPATYHHTYIEIGRRISLLTSVYTFAVIYRAFNVALFTLGFAALCHVMGLNRVDTLLAFLIYAGVTVFPVFRLAGYGVLLPTAEPDPTAWGCALIGYALAVKGRWYASAVMLGVTTGFHLLVGLQLSPPILIASFLSLSRRPRGLRSALFAWGLWLLPASIALIPQANILMRDPFSVESSHAYFVRAAHHLDAARFTIPLLTSVGVLSLGLALRRVRSENERQINDLPIVLALSFIGAYWAVGVVFRYLHLYGPLKFYPFRTWPMVLIITILHGVRALRSRDRCQGVSTRSERVFETPWVQVVFVLCSVASIATFCLTHLDVRNVAAMLVKSSATSSPPPVRLYDWIRANTSRDSVFLTPPEFWWGDFFWKSDRATIFHGKVFPVTSSGLVEWLRRKEMMDTLFERTSSEQGFEEGLARAVVDLNPDYVICPKGRVSAEWVSSGSLLYDAGYQGVDYDVFARASSTSRGSAPSKPH